MFTTKEVFQILNLIQKIQKFEESIFLVDFKRINNQNDINFNVSALGRYYRLRLGLTILKMRNNKTIKSGLETAITIQFGDKYLSIFEKINQQTFLFVQVIKDKAEIQKCKYLNQLIIF